MTDTMDCLLARDCVICGASFTIARADSTAQTCSRACRYKKAAQSTKAVWAANPEADAARKAKIAESVKRWAVENKELASERARARITAQMANPEYRRKNAERLAAIRAERKAEAAIRRKRSCPVCGVEFVAGRATAVGVCSRKCQDVVTAQKNRGRKASDDEKARKAAAGKLWRLTNPEQEERRKEAAKAACQTEDYREAALERYRRMEDAGVGICSVEIRALTASAAQWVMKKAKEALVLETDFVEVWTRVQDRLRREMPYDGPAGTADHFDYMRALGKALTADPELRDLQDDFMREAIPRFYAEWKAQKVA